MGNLNENSKYKVIPGGLTGNNLAIKIADYHSNLVKRLQDAELPSNTTAESTKALNKPISFTTPTVESSDGSPSVTLKPPPANKACSTNS